jgi:hypothetical protein
MRLVSRLVEESSVEIMLLMDETVSSMPFSSSGPSKPNDFMSNLV